MLRLLRRFETLKDSSVFVRNHISDISFLIGNYRIEHVLFAYFPETKRPVARVGETCIQVKGEVLFNIWKRGLWRLWFDYDTINSKHSMGQSNHCKNCNWFLDNMWVWFWNGCHNLYKININYQLYKFSSIFYQKAISFKRIGKGQRYSPADSLTYNSPLKNDRRIQTTR